MRYSKNIGMNNKNHLQSKVFISIKVSNNGCRQDVYFSSQLVSILKSYLFAGSSNSQSSGPGRGGAWSKSISSYVFCNEIHKGRLFVSRRCCKTPTKESKHNKNTRGGQGQGELHNDGMGEP